MADKKAPPIKQPKIKWKTFNPIKLSMYRGAFSALTNNVCELYILRRIRPKKGWKSYRKMLCTNNIPLLTSPNPHNILNFRSAQAPGSKTALYKAHNLIAVWDIIMQDYRCVNMDECYIVRTHPADESFWDAFNAEFLTMSTAEKLMYMDNL